MQYKPLTKKITNEDGTEHIVCAFKGTKECPIHTDSNKCLGVCSNMLNAILEQLHVFEYIYIEAKEQEGED